MAWLDKILDFWDDWSPVVLDAACALALVAVWAAPQAWGGPEMVRQMWFVALVDLVGLFVVLGVIMFSRREDPRESAWKGLTRALFWAAALVVGVGAAALEGGFFWPAIVLARLAHDAFRPVVTGKIGTLLRASYGVLLLLPCVFLAALVPWPVGGLVPDVVEAAALPGEGDLVTEPWKLFAFGVLWFSSHTLCGIHAARTGARRMAEDLDAHTA